MLIFFFVFIGLSFLILAHEAGHFLVAKIFGLKIDEFGFGFPPRLFAKKRGETEYSINWLPFGGFVKIAGEQAPESGKESAPPKDEAELKRYFHVQSPLRRAAITIAGVLVNFFLGWLLLSVIFMVGTPQVLLVGNIEDGSPAAQAGIQRGDVIAGYKSADEFIQFVKSRGGEEISINVFRDGEEKEIRVTPRKEILPGQGAIGVFLEEAGTEQERFFSALGQGFLASMRIAGLTLQAFYELLKNLISHGTLLEGVVGPVGIFAVAHDAGSLGAAYLIQLLAIISVNLAVLNLMPFPALDGGRLVLILIEKLKGSPLPRRVEMYANATGFVLLIILMVLVTIRDVVQW